MSQTSPEVQLKEALAALGELKTLAEGFKTKAEVVASADERISKVETAVDEIKSLATAMHEQIQTLAAKSKKEGEPALPENPMNAAEGNTLEGMNKTIVKGKKKDAVALDKEDVEEMEDKPMKKSKKAAEAEEEDEEEEDMEDGEEETKSKKSKKAGIPPQFLKNIKKKKEEMEDDETETKAAEEEEGDEEDMEDEEETKSKKSKKAAEPQEFEKGKKGKREGCADETEAPAPVAETPAAVEAPVAEAPVAAPAVSEPVAEPVAQVAPDTHAKELAELKAKFEAELKARDEALASVNKMKVEFESLLERINQHEQAEKSAEEKVAKAVAQMGAEPVTDAPAAQDDKPLTAEDVVKQWQGIKDAKESRAFYLAHEDIIRMAAFGKTRKNA